MAISFGSRLKHGWNAFINNKDPTEYTQNIGASYSYRPDRPPIHQG